MNRPWAGAFLSQSLHWAEAAKPLPAAAASAGAEPAENKPWRGEGWKRGLGDAHLRWQGRRQPRRCLGARPGGAPGPARGRCWPPPPPAHRQRWRRAPRAPPGAWTAEQSRGHGQGVPPLRQHTGSITNGVTPSPPPPPSSPPPNFFNENKNYFENTPECFPFFFFFFWSLPQVFLWSNKHFYRFSNLGTLPLATLGWESGKKPAYHSFLVQLTSNL